MNINHSLILLFGFFALINSENSAAQKYNSLIGNPFVFCSAPKPCKLCQPFRRIYTEICSEQNNANNQEDKSITPFYGNRVEVRGEIDRLIPMLNYQIALQEVTKNSIARCLQMNGRMHVEFCTEQMNDYEESQSSVRDYQQEIDRLEALLLQPDCRKNSRIRGCGEGIDDYER